MTAAAKALAAVKNRNDQVWKQIFKAGLLDADQIEANVIFKIHDMVTALIKYNEKTVIKQKISKI